MKAEKQLLKEEIKSKLDQYGDSFAIMQNLGLTANAAGEFRGAVATLGGNLYIMRKQILVKIANDLGIQLDPTALTGHIGMVFLGQNPLDTAKAVFKYGQENKTIQVLGLRYEGQLYFGPDAKKIAELPTKDEMRAQLLSVLEAPMAQTLAVMDAVLTSVVYCLDNKVKESAVVEEVNL
jgi:large subunit ribosomal protein L10